MKLKIVHYHSNQICTKYVENKYDDSYIVEGLSKSGQDNLLTFFILFLGHFSRSQSRGVRTLDTASSARALNQMRTLPQGRWLLLIAEWLLFMIVMRTKKIGADDFKVSVSLQTKIHH